MTVVDAWIQHPTPGFIGHPMFATLRRWMGLDEVPSEIPVGFTTAALDAAGVTRALICAWYGPEGALISNDEVAAFVAEDPDRLVGVASVDLRRPMAAIAELRRCVTELGFKALRLLPWLWDRPPNDRLYYPMIQPAEALAQVDGLGLTPAGREAFLSGNARRVFGL